MRWSRFAVAGLLVLGLALAGTAGPEDAKRLVGRWKVVKGLKGTVGSEVHFFEGGKLQVHTKVGVSDKKLTIEGTYKVEGKKLTVTLVTRTRT